MSPTARGRVPVGESRRLDSVSKRMRERGGTPEGTAGGGRRFRICRPVSSTWDQQGDPTSPGRNAGRPRSELGRGRENRAQQVGWLLDRPTGETGGRSENRRRQGAAKAASCSSGSPTSARTTTALPFPTSSATWTFTPTACASPPRTLTVMRTSRGSPPRWCSGALPESVAVSIDERTMRSGDSPCLRALIANSRSTRVTDAEKHPEGLPTPTTQGVA